MHTSILAKTFLLGEYLALTDNMALLVATDPAFIFEAQQNDTAIFSCPFHLESPAGKYWQQHQSTLQHSQCYFNDPYQGLGGFGGSTAEFISLYFLQNNIQIQNDEMLDWDRLAHLLTTYRELTKTNSGKVPSGADIALQASLTMPGVLHWDEQNKIRDSIVWPFSDLSSVLIHTNNKLATHSHLAGLDNLNTAPLKEAFLAALAGLQTADETTLLTALKQYQQHLLLSGWIADFTQTLLALLEQAPGFWFAKGCGAMGQDVIWLIYRTDKKPMLESWLQQHFAKNFIVWL